MDRAMLSLSLKDDDDSPFSFPDLPQYYASERNACSIIGRLLNPELQRMSKLIHDLPRKWQKSSRVRGFALTRERFQFVFLHEHDLREVLDKGMQTFEDWGLAMERWIEKPPPGYLDYVSIWVRISNIPVNHYTHRAIYDLGGLVGHVEEVAFDPERSQSQDYVRVKIRFHVSKPLKKSRVLNLPDGEQTTIYYYYERVQKRCYHCQRLTHAKERCPFLEHTQSSSGRSTSLLSMQQLSQPLQVLSEQDPLFGVLKEDQVGINPLSGRPRIAPEILQEMRNYLLASSSEDILVRQQRVIASVKEAEKNPITQRTALQLSPPPIFTSEINKGKGIVFNYDQEDKLNQPTTSNSQPKLMASAISSGQSLFNSTSNVLCRLTLPSPQNQLDLQGSIPFIFSVGSSGLKEKATRKPGSFKRIYNSRKKSHKEPEGTAQTVLPQPQVNKKRKAEDDLAGASKAAKNNASKMVPREGPSNT